MAIFKNPHTQLSFRALLVLLLTFILIAGNAQPDTSGYDKRYIVEYPNKLIITAFADKSLNSFTIAQPGYSERLKYHINQPSAIGLKLGYQFLTLSASVGIGNFDRHFNENNGNTKSLNLQTSFATNKFLIDLFFQNYKGMYLTTNDNSEIAGVGRYIRPDIKNSIRGIQAHYILNHRKFSSKPAFKLDARQKRSSGSFLVGLEFLSGKIKGDSSLVPTIYQKSHNVSELSQVNYLLFGPSVEYGYTKVFKNNFFATVIGALNANVAHVTEYSGYNQKSKNWDVSPKFDLKLGGGYNSNNWGVVFTYGTANTLLFGETKRNRYYTNNSNFRLSLIRRINAGKTVPKLADWTENIIEKLGMGFLVR